jgi:hypothetical protein
MKTAVSLLILLAASTGCVKEGTDPAAVHQPAVAPPPQESRESKMARTSPQPPSPPGPSRSTPKTP